MLSPGDHLLEFIWQDRLRRAIVHVPPGFDPPLPVVLAFHGSGTHAAAMREFCGLDEFADSAGFIAIFPDGTGRVDHARTWNAGECCGHAKHQHVDDVGFVSHLLDQLEATGQVDSQRVHATGMSNGGMMAYRLAAEVADRIASVCSVCGPLAMEPVRPTRRVSILHFHGTRDLFTPYLGGKGPRSISQGHSFRSVDRTIALWVQANDCDPEPTVEGITDGSDGFPITRRTYRGNGVEVVLYAIENAGHTWPGRTPTLETLGSATLAISANELMWSFFCLHPLHERPASAS